MLAILLVIVALLAPATAQADTAQVTVVSPGGTQQTLALEALAGGEDVVGRAYALRSSSGASSQAVTGYSLAKLVEAAGADPYSFSYLRVQRPGGGSVQLSRHQALDPAAFADGPPVVYATAGGTGFLRPSGGPDDLNAEDSFEAPQGLTIELSKGSPLQVRAEASRVRIKAGQKVEFSAEVEGGGAGERLAYSWYFDDGGSTSGPNAAHVFHKRGSYDVVLGVTTPSDSAGASDTIAIQVGPPLAGPDRKGGGTSKDASDPDHGAATGSGSSSAPPATAPEAAPVPSPAPASPAPVTPAPQTTAPQPPPGEVVSGELIGSERPAAPEPVETVAARTGNPSAGDGDGGGPGLPATGLGALLMVGLLGLGALSERSRWL